MGQVPIVLLLHGFPELWYSWFHQILYLAAHGYRAVAPDLRGYGDTTGAPIDDPTKFTTLHVVGDMVALIAALGVDKKIVDIFRVAYGDDHYICRFQEPGEIEAVFVSLGTKKVFEKFLTHRDPDPFYFPKDKPFGALYDTPVILPSWLSEEDVDYYTKKFEQTGFHRRNKLLPIKYSGNFLFNMLGKWKESEYSGQSVPVGGLAYYVTAPSQE
ncbi:unnamed protein product [Lactuca virosa]|uniref:AB hydrolase-1 domain-containing protein n=1 Tax=Lactuca virosa TaxID=75947 RepID=A0AAU9NV44_9ASTR|nr:unnamed protein product [Lactuca virosa]